MSERLSKPLTTPITMSAEQLEEIRKMPRSGVRTALLEELDAQIAAHAETREQLAQACKTLESLCDPPLSANRKWFLQTAASRLNMLDAALRAKQEGGQK